MLRVVRALIARGFDLALGRAVDLMQMLTPVSLAVMGLPACGMLRIECRTWDP